MTSALDLPITTETIMLRRVLLFWALLAGCGAALPNGQPVFNIVTGPSNGTYQKIGSDLAKLVAQPAGITMVSLPSNGSVDNVRRLRDEPGTKLALVQSDVYQAYTDEAAAGDAQAARMIQPLRVIMPLYDEEVHFIVRADSPLTHIHEIRDKRINIGPSGSGTAMTSTTVYRKLFYTDPPAGRTTTLPNQEALAKLAADGSIDVVIVVAGQPASLLSSLQGDAGRTYKLLKLDEASASSRDVLRAYAPAVIRSRSYPNLLKTDVPTLSVKTLLVTYDFPLGATQTQVVQMATSICRNIDLLQRQGHDKWQQVAPDLPALPKGWSYYRPTESLLKSCRKPSTAACPMDRQVLGLCPKT
ncbi:TAXI family TRAP transporter solute-binding subunit [Aquincola sp. S2]|uniref:TAXI family TRAP transporter solute-binding subunit n=1 Tax=Pseudaquabacterium terrae TaxID=2732868 RepID=A0ABX2EGT1_9BURK|nr:TAXI family TRAP transporter solute-binding subunit [Aquabacterium terrae]NRF67821.1 TAXI family TRAP transporter solute-binding subunit [Aquabacterium terrae]